MSEPETKRPLVEAIRGEQFKPTVILLASTALMITWKYFGSPEFYHDRLSSLLAIQGDQPAIAAAYSFVCCLLLLGVVPVLIVKLLLRENLADYGVRLGDRTRAVRLFLLLAPCFLLVGYLSSKDPSVTAQYPINRSAGASPAMFGFHLATYLTFYLGWEFCFRGFLQFGLRNSIGVVNAILIQTMASTLLHIGKPAVESYGAIAGGIVWGIVAQRTNSILAGFLLHCLLGMSLDWFICYM